MSDNFMRTESDEVSIHMIDPVDGRSLQKWSFSDPEIELISIGRDKDASVQLADPYVSRIHLELVRDAEGWTMFARGRNGVFVDGRNVAEYRLSHGTRFRLASAGLTFRFESEAATSGRQTLIFDPEVVNLLSLNSAEVIKQADEISQTDYFQALREKARELRRQQSHR